MEVVTGHGYTVYLTWLGILFCLTQSAMFSGLNLALFSVSRLRLEVEVASGNLAAKKLLKLRQDSNFLLTTVLWGNVGINVLLTLLSNSVMVGMSAFLFSTVAITLGGEIMPQAYFSRNALRMASRLRPVLRFYQILLYVIAKPSAMLLDLWLGKEGVHYMREQDLRHLIHKHIDAAETDVDELEGIGALNFLAIDDVPVSEEGEIIDKRTIIQLKNYQGRPQFFDPSLEKKQAQQRFVEQISATHYPWIFFVDVANDPVLALDADGYLRAVHNAEIEGRSTMIDPYNFCHQPVVITNPKTRLGRVISLFKSDIAAQSDAPLKTDLILLWADEKRIITGSDILGRLFKGIGLFSAIEKHQKL